MEMEMFSWPGLKTARLQSPAMRARAAQVGERLSKVAPGGQRPCQSPQVPTLRWGHPLCSQRYQEGDIWMQG